MNPASRASVIGNRPAPPEAGQGNQPIGGDGSRARPPTESASPNESRNPSELSPAERRELQELKRIDAKVRAHEQAHLAAAGQYAQGGISYQTKTGPDGQEYAVAGEVSLDTSEAETPEQTIQKMRQVKAAALAPANPSAQDRQIASQAAQKLSEAQLEKAQNRGGESPENNDSGSTENASGEGNSRSQGTSTGYERPDEFGAGSPGEDGPGVYSEAGRPDGNDRSNKISQFITEPSPTGGQPSSGRALNLLA
ncbi:MAG: putative metalloprotease CJM1_0395 family protein [bacterium]